MSLIAEIASLGMTGLAQLQALLAQGRQPAIGTTLELKVAYHRAMTSSTGTVRAEGRVLSIGRRTAFAEARLTDTSGRLLASATSTLMVITP